MYYNEDNVFKISVLILFVAFIVKIFYCNSVYHILKKVPRENQQYPLWIVWLFLIPLIGLIFEWMMLPFGIPNAFKKTFSTNQDAINDANSLFKLGIAQLVFTMLGIFFVVKPINQICAIVGLIVWIVYWIKIVRFKNRYLITNAG